MGVGGGVKKRLAESFLTSMTGSCPLTATFNCVLEKVTMRSLPFKFEATGTVMSRSVIVCVHLYGSLACSSASRARSALSDFSRSDGVGEDDIVGDSFDDTRSWAAFDSRFKNITWR